jgi:hypothetical protein
MTVYATTKDRSSDLFSKLVSGLSDHFAAPTQTDYPGLPPRTYVPRWFIIHGKEPDDLIISGSPNPATGSVYLYEGESVRQGFNGLAIYAENGDEKAFIAAANAIGWDKASPDDHILAIRQAVSAGAFLIARRIAEQGLQRYPDNIDLKKFVQLLAPPKVVKRPETPKSSVKANRNWIKTQAQNHQGMWVALKDGELLATAKTIKELINQIGNPKDTGILITQIV